MKQLIAGLIFLISLDASSLEEMTLNKLYTVKKGDTLGSILLQLKKKPLWGINGSVQKTIDLNKVLLNPKGDLILENSVIKIPVEPLRIVATENKRPEVVPEIESLSTVSSDSSDHLYSDLNLDFGFQYLELNSTDKANDTKAKLESKLNPSIHLKLNYKWSPLSETFVGLGLEDTSFSPVAGKKIINLSNTYANLLIGQKINLGNEWKFAVALRHRQLPYLRANSVDQFKLESPWIKEFSLFLERLLVQKNNASMWIVATPYYLSSKKLNDFKINEGRGISFNLNIIQKFKKFDLRSSIFSEIGEQHSSISKQTWQSNGLYVGLTFPMGEIGK